MQDRGTDGDDESGVLGEVQELGRREHAELRVFPPQQRLDPDDLGPLEADDRLVIDGN